MFFKFYFQIQLVAKLAKSSCESLPLWLHHKWNWPKKIYWSLTQLCTTGVGLNCYIRGHLICSGICNTNLWSERYSLNTSLTCGCSFGWVINTKQNWHIYVAFSWVWHKAKSHNRVAFFDGVFIQSKLEIISWV
jgi:hypothetical protein